MDNYAGQLQILIAMVRTERVNVFPGNLARVAVSHFDIELHVLLEVF